MGSDRGAEGHIVIRQGEDPEPTGGEPEKITDTSRFPKSDPPERELRTPPWRRSQRDG